MLAVLLAAGCTGSGAAGAGRGAQAPGPTGGLVGVEWRLTDVVEQARTWSPPPDADVRLRFDGAGGWSGQPCNRYSGSVQIDGDVVTFATGSGTEMFCDGERGALERAFLAVVDGSARWRVEGGELRIDKPDGQGLRFAAG
ncbi:META domain-containing protein [Phytohabitans suffuscus]|uniref:META domain-containing protein n=1 Tax=Phytohabitans suffuscus TaxID=624315 RepID=UPI0015637B59|nr:META domain-containing protein [Phytohabitans suffuscus]